MRLDLSLIRGAGERVERDWPADAFAAWNEDFRVVDGLHFVADGSKDQNRYLLSGRATTRLALDCSRCLEPFVMPVEVTFSLRYLPRADNEGEGEIEVAEEDLDTAYHDAETIDLGDLLREQLYLALPMKPLCRPDCQGLCPSCGGNRNLSSCDCDTAWQDPRLEGLKRLLDDSGTRQS
jgi:uncharacterized protein